MVPLRRPCGKLPPREFVEVAAPRPRPRDPLNRVELLPPPPARPLEDGIVDPRPWLEAPPCAAREGADIAALTVVDHLA